MNREGVERLCAVASRSSPTPLATRVRTTCTLRWSVAILIWVLSGSLPLAQYFLIDHRKHLLRVEEEQDELVLALQLLAWWRLPAVTASVEAALGDLSHKARIQADQFLVRSLVAEFVLEKNQRGIPVASQHVIEKYLRLWSVRPSCEAVQIDMHQMTWHVNRRTKFLQQLKHEWLLGTGFARPGRALTPPQLSDKVRNGLGRPPQWLCGETPDCRSWHDSLRPVWALGDCPCHCEPTRCAYT